MLPYRQKAMKENSCEGRQYWEKEIKIQSSKNEISTTLITPKLYFEVSNTEIRK